MSEKELDEILNNIREGNNDDIHFTLSAEEPNKDESEYVDLLDFNNGTSNHKNKKDNKNPKNKKKKIIIISVIVAVVIAVVVGVICYAMANRNKEVPTTTTTKPVVTQEVKQILNPLTGEAGFRAGALKSRPVAVVVENEYSTEAVRPQWAINDADIVLEGESEFSTRLLLFWADYTKVPEMVGPTRSARPPFIKFSQLFDCVFIHAGLSSSKGDYVGADAVFEDYDVDHINLLSLSEDGNYFGRNNERNTAVEHTGYLNGTKLPDLLKEKEIPMELDKSKFSTLNFNKKATGIK